MAGLGDGNHIPYCLTQLCHGSECCSHQVCQKGYTGKVRLGSVHLGEEAFPGKVRLGSVQDQSAGLVELGDGVHIPGLVGNLGEEAFGFLLMSFPDMGMTFPGKVRLGSVQDQSAGLVDHLGEEAVGFLLPSFPDKGMTSLVDFLGKGAVGFPFLGKVRLGSGKEAAGFLFLVWFHEHSTNLAEL